MKQIPEIIVSQPLTECLITGKPVKKILDFGQHPYADTFIAENQLNLSEPIFPLQVFLNEDSGSIQLGYLSDAEDRYNLYAYSYTSSNSATSRKHWEEYAQYVQERYKHDNFIVEIGSNDGYLLKQFKNTKQVLGIDISQAMADIANNNGVNTICRKFDYEVGQEVNTKFGDADVVIANNVFNHTNDPVDFACGVSELLAVDGVFIFELPYWGKMIECERFTDMVYHEHISYFTIKSAQNLLKAAGMTILDFDIVNYHGGSIRVTAKLDDGTISEKVSTAIAQEEDQGLFDTQTYDRLQQKFEMERNQWLLDFYQILDRDPNAVIIAVGAAAKGNTWLNWHRLDKTVIKYVTDSSSFKQGKYTPLSRIPIIGDEIFAQYENPYALILSWNIGEPLKQALLKINPNTKFISQ